MHSKILLSKALEAIENRMGYARSAGCAQVAAAMPVCWLAGEPAPPALRRGGVHEWLGLAPAADMDGESAPAQRGSLNDWTPALALSTHAAMCALRVEKQAAGVAVWIGRRCWPYPHQLARVGSAMLERCVFVDPADTGARVWSIDLALRSAAVSVVVADGSGLDMAASRRLQLAAEAGAVSADRAGSAGGIGLLLRPWWEMASITAAWTRWLVRREPAPGRWPRWRVELLRHRAAAGAIGIGTRGLGGAANIGAEGKGAWVVEWDRADAGVVVPAGVGGGTGAAARASVGDAAAGARLIA